MQDKRKDKKWSLFPRLFDIGLRFTIAKKMITGERKKEKEFGDALHVLTFMNYQFLEIDFSLFFYALTKQIKVKEALLEIIDNAGQLKGFKINDIDAFDLFNEGLKYADKGNNKKAIEYFTKAIDKSPNNPMYQLELCQLHYKIGNIKKADDIRTQIHNITEQQKDPTYLKQEFSEFLDLFHSKKDLMRFFIDWKEEYFKLLEESDGLILSLNTLTKELERYFKEESLRFSKKILSKVVDDCYEILQWLSSLAALVFFHLEYGYGHDDFVKELSDAITSCLGGIPDPLPQDQDFNLVSPEKRKKAWEFQLGMDIMLGTFIESIRDATYLRIGNSNEYTWISKGSKEIMNIEKNVMEQHTIHKESERDKIEHHIVKHFGEPLTIIHDKGNRIVHIDVYIIPPSKDREYSLLISSGMSERPMEAPPDAWRCWGIDISRVPEERRSTFACNYAELVIKLPPNWSLATPDSQLKQDDQYIWPILEIYHLINYVHHNKEWFWHSHTMRSRQDGSEYFANNTKLSVWVFLFPPHLPPSISILKVSDSKAICFLQLIPLYHEEILFAMQYQTERLFERFAQYNIPDYIDLNRKNTCK